MLNRSTRCLRAILMLLVVVLGLGVMLVPTEAAELKLSDLHMPVSVESYAVKVYRTASSGSQVIGLMENGRKIDVVGSTRNYYKIDCYGSKGYVSKTHVVKEQGKYYINCKIGKSDVVKIDTYSATEVSQMRSSVISMCKKQIGDRYVFGSAGPYTFDCSGLFYYSFKRAIGLQLERTTFYQVGKGLIVSRSELEPGDFIFFHRTDGSSKYVSHVGIYIGSNKFIHASTSRGVIIAELNDYWMDFYRGVRRMLVTTSAVSEWDVVHSAQAAK